MRPGEFEIGREYPDTATGHVWRCTDIGTRTVIPIRVDRAETREIRDGVRGPIRTLTREEAEKQGWFRGPPYAVAGCARDEYSLDAKLVPCGHEDEPFDPETFRRLIDELGGDELIADRERGST